MANFKTRPSAFINQLKHLLKERYQEGFPIIKEIIQNANDGKANKLDFGIIDGLGERVSHPLLKKTALFFINDGLFTSEDYEAIQYFAVDVNAGNKEKIGKFGLGQKSVFHFCEAFFFIANSVNLSNQEQGLFLNPWSESNGKDKKKPEWTELSDKDRDYLEKFLLNKKLINKKQYFVLWIPIREQENQDNNNRYILANFYTLESIKQYFPDDMEQKIASLLPMLRYLKEVRYWQPNNDHKLEKQFEIIVEQEKLERFLYPNNDNNKQNSHKLQGTINISNTNFLKFAGEECILSADCFKYLIPKFVPNTFWKDLQDSEYWSRRSAIDEHGEDLIVPDKSIPHCAVIFADKPSQNKQAKLTIQWAVFLPMAESFNEQIEEFEIIDCEGDQDYVLTLHGYFFLDSGRKQIDALRDIRQQKLQDKTPTKEEEMIQQWNKILVTKGTLPLILSSLEHFVKTHILSPQSINNLCKSIKRTKLWNSPFYQNNLLEQYQFIECIHPDKNKIDWQLLEVEKKVLTLPSIPNWNVFSYLKQLADSENEKIYFTLSERPHLCPKNKPDKWDEEHILDVLESLNPETIFTKKEHITYLEAFLKEATKNKLSAKIQDKLAELLKKGLFREIAEDLKQNMRSLISLIDKNKLFVIDCDQDILQSIYQLQLGVLVIHEDLKLDRSNQEFHSAKDAISILKCLSNIREQEDTHQKQSKLYELIKFVLKSANKHLQTIFENCDNLPVKGENLKTSGQEFYILSEIQASNFFAKSGNNKLAQLLQEALANQEIILIDKEISEILKPVFTLKDSTSCLRLLSNNTQLSEPQNRINLLKELLKNG